MGDFEVKNQVSREVIKYEDFKKQMEAQKLSQEQINAIWTRYNTDGNEELNQEEQIGLMSFLLQMAGDDKQVTKKEAKTYKTNFGVEMSHDDYGRMTAGFTNVIKGKEVQVAQGAGKSYTVEQDGKKTTYKYGADGAIEEEVIEDTANNKTTTRTYAGSYGNKYVSKEVVIGKATDGNTTGTGTITTDYVYQHGKSVKAKETVIVKNPNLESTTTTSYQVIGGESIPNKETNYVKYASGDVSYNESIYNQETETFFSVKKHEEKTVGSEKIETDIIYDNDQISQATIKKGGKTTTTTVDKKSGTTTVKEFDPTTQQETETVYSTANISVGSDNSVIVGNDNNTPVKKTIVKDKKKNTVKTTEGNVVTTQQLSPNGMPIRTTKYDKPNNKYTYNTTTFDTDESGNILANTAWNEQHKRMETVGEAAIRIGLDPNSQDYQDFVKLNGGKDKKLTVGSRFKIPQKAMGADKNVNMNVVNIDATAQTKRAQQYQAIVVQQQRVRAAEVQKRCGDNFNGSADAVLANWDKKATTRCTFATDSHRVFCEINYHDKDKKDYQQHYVYSTYNNKVVKIEDLASNIPAGEHVKSISANGTARLTNGKVIHIDLNQNKYEGKQKVNTYDVQAEQEKLDKLIQAYKNDKSGSKWAEDPKIKGETLAKISTEDFLNMKERGETLADIEAAEKNLADIETAVAKYNNSLQDPGHKLYKTSNPYIYFCNGTNTYMYYDAVSKSVKKADGITGLDSNGSIKMGETTISNENYLKHMHNKNFAEGIYSHLGGQCTMEEFLDQTYNKVKNITKDDVIDVYSCYADYDGGNKNKGWTILQQATPLESGGNGKGKKDTDGYYVNRKKAYNIACHIVNCLIQKADDVGIAKTNKAYSDALVFTGKSKDPTVFNPDYYLNGSGDRKELRWTGDAVIRNLTELIEATEAANAERQAALEANPENDEFVTEEEVAEEVVEKEEEENPTA